MREVGIWIGGVLLAVAAVVGYVAGVPGDQRMPWAPLAEASDPATVVLVLHWGGGTGAAARERMGWGDEKDGIPVFYPDGVNGEWNSGWELSGSTRDDVAYLSDLVAGYDRVLVAGFSQGGMMSYRLACEGVADVIAVKSGGLPQGLECATTVPVTHWHGKLDEIVPIAGDEYIRPLWWTRALFAEGCQDEVRFRHEDGSWVIRWWCGGESYEVETRTFPEYGHAGMFPNWSAYAWWWLTR